MEVGEEEVIYWVSVTYYINRPMQDTALFMTVKMTIFR